MSFHFVVLRPSSERVRRGVAPFLTLLTLLAAVPRPGFFAHQHAGDVAGHVHAFPESASASADHAHTHAHAAAHHESGVAPHVHSEHGAGDSLLFAAASREAGDHWHSQAPFQHAAASYARVITPVARVEVVGTAPARVPPAAAPPSARSRGPPLFTPSH